MNNRFDNKNILFLDIETVSQVADYNLLTEEDRKFWDLKSQFLMRSSQLDGETSENLYDRAAIYAEFGKIICISVGYVNNEKIRIKSFSNKNEIQLLFDFAAMLNSHYSDPQSYLCAHNGKEFDFPYISRRMLINGVKLPTILNTAGAKPWEVKHLDTMEMWKFGDYKNYTSLALLCHIFNIPSPKDDIDGNMVGKVFWQDNNLERIVEYCQKDVVALIQLYLKFNNYPLIESNNIEFF